MILSILRVIKFALQDIFRNFGLSFMTVLILILMLLSINTLISIRFVTGEAVRLVKDQIDVSIFFDHEVNDDTVQEVRTFIQSFPEVVSLTYFTREEVLEQFREEHLENPDILASLEELDTNPLGPTVVVKTREPGDYQKIIKALDIPEYEDIIVTKTFVDTEKAISKVNSITYQVERFGYGLSALFGVIAFFIIFNTIRVAIFTHRTEISIKKLVGATNWFIRSPYVIESFLFSVIGVGISFVIIMFAARLIDPYIGVIFGESSMLTNYYISNIILLLSSQFGAVLLLTVFSSSLAMRRYLRV